MSIDFWKLDGTRFSTLPDLVSYNGYVKDANGDVYETKANSAVITKKQFTHNVTANTGWISGSGNCVSNIAIGEDGSLTATKTNLDNRYFTEDEIKANYIPWDARWDGTGGGFYRDGNVFINGNGYSDYLTNILTGIKNTINGLGSIYARIGDCYTKNESNERYPLKSSISNATITINQGNNRKGSFTLNGGGATINLDAGGATGNASGTQGWIRIGNILVQWLKISTARETPYPYGTYASPPLGFYSFCSQNYHWTADCSDYSGLLMVSTWCCRYDQDGDNRYPHDISVMVLGVAAS